MPDLNDFYVFKMTSGDNSHGNSNNSAGCGKAIIILAAIGWVLWIIGRF